MFGVIIGPYSFENITGQAKCLFAEWALQQLEFGPKLIRNITSRPEFYVKE